jgi:glucose/arabinose dehydrogenase
MRIMVLVAAVLVAGCGLGERSVATTGAAIDAAHCAPDNGGLTLPEGFCALVAHEGVGPARHLAVTPDGRVYVALRQPQDGAAIVALRDTDGDGRLDEEARFEPTGGTGIAVREGWLYFAPTTFVLRYRLPADGLVPEGAPDTVVGGFPDQRSHAAKTFTFDGAGRLYVNVGGPSNACQERDRQPDSPGQRPCPELERQTGVWRFPSDAVGLRQEDGSRFATGIRNAVAIAWNHAQDGLYVVDHGRDMLNVMDPDNFDAEANAELPAEEFLQVEQGDDFGHPYCYHDHHQGRRVLAPEYGGDGREVGECDRLPLPIYSYPAHWAPNDLLFYDGTHFPGQYRNAAFVAWHGSWNRAPLPQRGYKVTAHRMDGGRPAGEFEVFADGFAGVDPIGSPGDARFRPMGLAQAPDGSLYIVDSGEGRIWRVLYRGDR